MNLEKSPEIQMVKVLPAVKEGYTLPLWQLKVLTALKMGLCRSVPAYLLQRSDPYGVLTSALMNGAMQLTRHTVFEARFQNPRTAQVMQAFEDCRQQVLPTPIREPARRDAPLTLFHFHDGVSINCGIIRGIASDLSLTSMCRYEGQSLAFHERPEGCATDAEYMEYAFDKFFSWHSLWGPTIYAWLERCMLLDFLPNFVGQLHEDSNIERILHLANDFAHKLAMAQGTTADRLFIDDDPMYHLVDERGGGMCLSSLHPPVHIRVFATVRDLSKIAAKQYLYPFMTTASTNLLEGRTALADRKSAKADNAIMSVTAGAGSFEGPRVKPHPMYLPPHPPMYGARDITVHEVEQVAGGKLTPSYEAYVQSLSPPRLDDSSWY